MKNLHVYTIFFACLHYFFENKDYPLTSALSDAHNHLYWII